MTWFTAIETFILAHAGNWWTYLLTGALCWLDGFFPPLPSESIVIAMASLAFSGGPVKIWLVLPFALVGAFLGDNTAYWIGRFVPMEKLFRGARGAAMIAKAHDLVHAKGAQVLLTARFIPIYRVAVNMTAGAVRFPYRRFVLIDIVSATMWACVSIGIGVFAGAFLKGHPLLGIIIGIGIGFLVGFAIDAVMKRRAAR